jgi:hypothetical protein
MWREEKKNNAYKSPLESLRKRWDSNFKIDIMKVGTEDVRWMKSPRRVTSGRLRYYEVLNFLDLIPE